MPVPHSAAALRGRSVELCRRCLQVPHLVEHEAKALASQGLWVVDGEVATAVGEEPRHCAVGSETLVVDLLVAKGVPQQEQEGVNVESGERQPCPKSAECGAGAEGGSSLTACPTQEPRGGQRAWRTCTPRRFIISQV